MMFGKLNLALLLGIVLCLGGIFLLQRDPGEPNYELVLERQMARSPAFGAFSANPNFADGITLRQPVTGTIAQGLKPFPYGSGPTEAARAGKELTSPLSPGNQEARQRGAFLYATYCQFCHGETGLGDGPVSRRGFPAPLSFLTNQALQMSDGEMFHILTHGKGNMPAHAWQLSPADRWAVILQVRALQKKFTAAPDIKLADTIKLFKTHCAACHADDGTGSLLRVRLPNLPDFTSLAWQLSQTNLEIINRIEYGDEPLMPSFRYQLTRAQILGLAIYIRTFASKREGPEAVPAVPATAAGLTPVQIFRAYCLACHNVDGRGAIVRPGMPDIPDFTSAAWHGTKPDAELSKAILSGGKFMPPMKDKLTPADADKMVKFVRAFKDGKQVVSLESQEVPKGPVPVPPALVDVVPPVAKDKVPPEPTSPELANRLRAAAVLFRQYCIVCHGPDGTGSVMRAALPPLPDFTNVTWQEQHSDPQLLISVLDGKGGLMPANRGRINEPQARDLIAYIRAFAPTATLSSALPPSEFQRQFEQLQQQWDALQKQVQALKKP
jgi:mono/diheme cytochrome c family protein